MKQQPLALLRRGLAELRLALPEAAVTRLASYLALLAKWNRVYNLTAIREDSRLVSHHLLDSLAIVPYLPVGAILDVGSGAGLPGIPLAIACPDRKVVLLDSNQKKAAFLKQAAAELGLANAEVVVARIESYGAGKKFDVVISRAFADLADFANLAGAACAAGGALIAMKGIYPHEEIARLPAAWTVEKVVPLQVPQMAATRHLVFLRHGAA